MRSRLGISAFRDAYRRHANAIARRDLLRILDSLAVDPDLAAANDPVDVALGNSLEARDQVVVDALAGLVFRHLDPAYGRGLRNGGFSFDRHACILYVIDFQYLSGCNCDPETGQSSAGRGKPRKAGQRRAPAKPSSDGSTKQTRSTLRIRALAGSTGWTTKVPAPSATTPPDEQDQKSPLSLT
jgi:hypothetical protein